LILAGSEWERGRWEGDGIEQIREELSGCITSKKEKTTVQSKGTRESDAQEKGPYIRKLSCPRTSESCKKKIKKKSIAIVKAGRQRRLRPPLSKTKGGKGSRWLFGVGQVSTEGKL